MQNTVIRLEFPLKRKKLLRKCLDVSYGTYVHTVFCKNTFTRRGRRVNKTYWEILVLDICTTYVRTWYVVKYRSTNGSYYRSFQLLAGSFVRNLFFKDYFRMYGTVRYCTVPYRLIFFFEYQIRRFFSPTLRQIDRKLFYCIVRAWIKTNVVDIDNKENVVRYSSSD